MHFHSLLKLILVATCCMLLSACGESPSGPYAKWMYNDESVLSVAQQGPFTILHIEHRPRGWGSFSGTGSRFDRILYKDKIVVKEARITEAWKDAGNSAILAEIYSETKSRLNLVYELNGKAVVKRIDAGKDGWSNADFGEPIGPGLRYFANWYGNTQGFLMRAFPIEAKVLPLGPQKPAISQLASVAPDWKAFAYTDNLEAPSLFVVVHDDGSIGEPIPVPVTSNQARTWFNVHFKWSKKAGGRWDIARVSAMPAQVNAGSALEELFLDADAGYRNCFANSSACQAGWRREAISDTYDCECHHPYLFKPSRPTQAFGANVRELWYARYGGGFYDLVLDAPPEKVADEIRKRLDGRHTDYLGPGQVSRERVESFLKKDSLQDDWIRSLSNKPQSIQFVMPTVAVRVEAEGHGTLLRTIGRYQAIPFRDTSLENIHGFDVPATNTIDTQETTSHR